MRLPDARFATHVTQRDGDLYLEIPSDIAVELALADETPVLVSLDSLDGVHTPGNGTNLSASNTDSESKYSPELLRQKSDGGTRRQTQASDGPPVDEGETISLDIEELGDHGDGIGFVDGYTIIVDGADVGDRVKAHIESTEANYAFATIAD